MNEDKISNVKLDENFFKNQQKAKQKLLNIDISKEKAINKMYKTFGITPDSDISIKKKINPNDLPRIDDCRHHRVAMIFPDEMVYSFTNAKKFLFETKFCIYQYNTNSCVNRGIGLDLDQYYISYIDNKPYLNVITSNIKYKYYNYLLANKSLSELYQQEPFDISISAYIMVNEKNPFPYYRLDNNKTNYGPHPNRLKNGLILSTPEYVYGPHEHMYTELQAILYQDFPYSYDAKTIWSRRHDMATIARPPLTNNEIYWRLKNYLNVEDITENSEITDLLEYNENKLCSPNEILQTANLEICL